VFAHHLISSSDAVPPTPYVCLLHLLMLGARETQEYAQRCLEVGMSDVLFKPLQREDLMATLRKWTSTHHRELPDTKPTPT
jgi:CheY-like chemotaxis protein